MNQSNAAQPVLTDHEIRAVWVEHGLDDEAVEDFARAIESALLSKLRAPVAQERPAFEASYKRRQGTPINLELLRDGNGYTDGADGARNLNVAWETWQDARAALASAPVAGEAHPFAAAGPLSGKFADVMADNYDALLVRPDAAPQASEAQCSCPSGDGSLRHPCAVHPAGEAARDAGIAASEDHMRPDLDRGVAGSFQAFTHWVTNHPNDQIYVHSAHEGFLAGAEWCRQQSAALSAQPGAQKKEQSDA